MSGRAKVARFLVGLGCIVLVAAAGLHSIAAYPRVSSALTASNLDPGLQVALRVIFLAVGWHWAVIAALALLSAFSDTRLCRVLTLICGLSLLVEAGFGAALMGVFIGNEMIGAAGLLISGGAFLSRFGDGER